MRARLHTAARRTLEPDNLIPTCRCLLRKSTAAPMAFEKHKCTVPRASGCPGLWRRRWCCRLTPAAALHCSLQPPASAVCANTNIRYPRRFTCVQQTRQGPTTIYPILGGLSPSGALGQTNIVASEGDPTSTRAALDSPLAPWMLPSGGDDFNGHRPTKKIKSPLWCADCFHDFFHRQQNGWRLTRSPEWFDQGLTFRQQSSPPLFSHAEKRDEEV